MFLDVKMEKVQQLVSGIEGFDSTKLRHTETNEKNPLPDKDGMYMYSHFILLNLKMCFCMKIKYKLIVLSSCFMLVSLLQLKKRWQLKRLIMN